MKKYIEFDWAITDNVVHLWTGVHMVQYNCYYGFYLFMVCMSLFQVSDTVSTYQLPGGCGQLEPGQLLGFII